MSNRPFAPVPYTINEFGQIEPTITAAAMTAWLFANPATFAATGLGVRSLARDAVPWVEQAPGGALSYPVQVMTPAGFERPGAVEVTMDSTQFQLVEKLLAHRAMWGAQVLVAVACNPSAPFIDTIERMNTLLGAQDHSFYWLFYLDRDEIALEDGAIVEMPLIPLVRPRHWGDTAALEAVNA